MSVLPRAAGPLRRVEPAQRHRRPSATVPTRVSRQSGGRATRAASSSLPVSTSRICTHSHPRTTAPSGLSSRDSRSLSARPTRARASRYDSTTNRRATRTSGTCTSTSSPATRVTTYAHATVTPAGSTRTNVQNMQSDSGGSFACRRSSRRDTRPDRRTPSRGCESASWSLSVLAASRRQDRPCPTGWVYLVPDPPPHEVRPGAEFPCYQNDEHRPHHRRNCCAPTALLGPTMRTPSQPDGYAKAKIDLCMLHRWRIVQSRLHVDKNCDVRPACRRTVSSALGMQR